jgi:ribosomal protein S18 acetylase RimI-like enzyme
MESCPFLPLPDRRFTHDDIHALGSDRSEQFYFTAMRYAQTLWLDAFPAKALLLVNRALSCHLPDTTFLPSTVDRPPSTANCSAAPNHAKAWIMRYRPADKFIGNPCRHYQHLATRMVEPHKELRVWRAWACWYLAKELLPEAEFPQDTQQVRQEQVVKPTRALIAEQLASWSPLDDLTAWQDALAMVQRWMRKDAPSPVPDLTFRLIAREELEVVRRLAHEIWPAAYREMISAEQIRYMLERMYAPDELRQEMVVRGVKYALLESAGLPCGYMAWELVPNDRSIFLHKLYVKTELHGRGAGAASLRWLEQLAEKENASCIRLRVNRNNHRAIRAYLRAGFTFGHDLCSDIGGGFVMDDHVMVKVISNQ